MSYERQDRGDLDAYTRYLANMDAAMRQKVAMTAAHLPCQGRVADMGMGSGSGSHALAALYPRLEVIGVDVNPTMVEVARGQYQLPNLSFRVGDIARICFEPNSLDGIVNSSVLHHVTSYNGYLYDKAAEALEAQVEQLAPGGCLIVRDFLAPPPGRVELRIPQGLKELWNQFSSQFRALRPEDERGFSFEDLGLDPRGWWRLGVEQRLAVEFVLRKDYTQDWAQEIQEEYTYFTQEQFEAHFARLGLRVLVSTPLHNPWIVENRFEGQFEFYSEAGTRLDFPPTNYLIVGEKVAKGQGVGFRATHAPGRSGFLSLSSYRHRVTQKTYDLVCRPNPTVDVLPYLVTEAGNLSVLVRHSYPRPILTLLQDSLDGFRPCPYVVEPLTAVQGQDPVAETVESLLVRRAGVHPEKIRSLWWAGGHYPSPGGIREEVLSCFAELDQDFEVDGSLRALDAHQLLRSAQVHGLADHRLEMLIFELMRHLKIDPGPWLGDQLKSQPQRLPPKESVWEFDSQRMFLPGQESAGFLDILARHFVELDAQVREGGRTYLEAVIPRQLSSLTLAVLPMVPTAQGWWVALDLEDLPAAQAFSGNSRQWIAPAWRLPKGVGGQAEARDWVGQSMSFEYGLEVEDWAPLGGPYFPTPGLTPELVYPLAARVRPGQQTSLHFFPLEQLMQRWESVQNGHLRCLLLRAWLAHRQVLA
ncbi:methyltransferase domain-containing protein [bacterium]|nr:methyltransferase domain-containing protein [bacterium]